MVGLHDEPFGHRITKDGRVRISWRWRTATTIAGTTAARLVAAPEAAADAEAQQQLLARATGNFERGERAGGGNPRATGAK